MSLKCIGAGFGRTGTLSLKMALEQLGMGRCYHMFEVSPDKVPLWQRAWDEAAGGEFPWDDIFDGYGCAVDWPACQFWRALLARYTDAKCVLTVRDPASWYESVQKTIYVGSEMMRKAKGEVIEARTRMVYSVIWDGAFAGRFEDRDYAIECYERHIQEVIDAVPSERLLVFDVKQGWQPLCAFLGKEVPDAPFPRSNTGEDFQKLLTPSKKS